MFFLDLKRAAVAIASGRLDDAFEVLQSSPERRHRDGQRLTDRLVAAYLERATRQLAAGRVEDARHDGDNAQCLAGRTPEITEFLQEVSAAEADRRLQQQRRRDVLAAAQQQLQVGAYTAGAELLGGLDAHQSAAGVASAEHLAASIEAQRLIVETAASRIQVAIEARQYESAAAMIGGLTTSQRAHPKIVTLTQQTVGSLVERGLADLVEGRLDRAAAIDDILRPLQAGTSEVSELQQCLARCRSVREHLAAHHYAEAESQLSVLAQMIAGGTWIEAACGAVAEAQRHLRLLSTGPLGLLEGGATDQPAAASVRPAQQATSVQPFDRRLPDRSVLQVDGIGGLLLLSQDRVTIGPSSSSSASEFDLPLLTEGAGASISIRRDGDDYFVESAAEFAVNGQPLTRRLLASGDSIAVGARGRLRFLKPVAASASAVLQITGSRLARRDIRSVVLMSDTLLFGPYGSHFRLPGAEHPLVLHRSREGYVLREAGSRAAASVSGAHPVPTSLGVGESVVMNDVRFALVEG